MSSTSRDNPFCRDENYPVLIHNYFHLSVPILNRKLENIPTAVCIHHKLFFFLFFLLAKDWTGNGGVLRTHVSCL